MLRCIREAVGMMNRERVVLHALHLARKPVEKLALVKLLFLVRRETAVGDAIPFYDFVPYQYGPFSFVLYNDLRRLGKAGLVRETKDTVELAPESESQEAFLALKKTVRDAVTGILSQYGELSSEKVMEYVYDRYPWFASRSKLRPPVETKPAPVAAYTVGYEGRSLDAFMDCLLHSGIRRIVDVRRNAYSMKYGFSRGVLGPTAEKCGMDYIHVPEVGIASDKRQDLKTRADYDRLLDRYESELLPSREAGVLRVGELLAEKPSALLCYEADPTLCHRGRLATTVARQAALQVVHL